MRSQNGERLQNHSLHAGSNWIFIVALLCLAPGCSSDVVDVVDVENTADAPPGHVVPGDQMPKLIWSSNRPRLKTWV